MLAELEEVTSEATGEEKCRLSIIALFATVY
jgi:hypothetical protein